MMLSIAFSCLTMLLPEGRDYMYICLARSKRSNPQRQSFGFQGRRPTRASNSRKSRRERKTIKRMTTSQETQPYKKTLEGQINEEFKEWLNRSLLCTIDEPRDLGSLASAIIDGFGQCSKIYTLSSFNFILTLPTLELMEESLMNHEELETWFYDIKKWAKDDFWDTRKVWLDMYGVPPHG
ncbi:hypothetical protein Cgig2_005956 [Carnegiea gigantea]|uniref:Uncharacterized protein n=1 Tax=Carnegiea gigantea TaxID=171969 RepID=A0A9Q1QJS5_9CARY|nr:hypothetical protein Cgig2_005956 [Carnegiea gigantea]